MCPALRRLANRGKQVVQTKAAPDGAVFVDKRVLDQRALVALRGVAIWACSRTAALEVWTVSLAAHQSARADGV